MSQPLMASEQFTALKFSDLYIRNAFPSGESAPVDTPRLTAKYLPNERDRTIDTLRPVPEELYADIERLYSLLGASAKGKEEFSIQFRPIRFRVTLSRDTLYGDVYHLRRIPEKVPSLTELGIHEKVQKLLAAMGRARGLVMITGGTSQGKTTTAVTTLKAALDDYGGFAIAIQDAEEFPLSAEYGDGKGLCIEVMVDDDDGWEPALIKALRQHPRYILVGEVRTAKAAVQVLRMALAGQLVIVTFHGGSIEEALEAFAQVAARDMGVQQANQVLANGLCAIFNQSLGKTTEMSFLIPTPGPGDSARIAIREGRFGALGEIADRQRTRAMMAGSANGV